MSVHLRVSEWLAGFEARHSGRPWDGFLEEYAPVLLQVVGRFTDDEDQVHDCFVFVCRKLKQRNLEKLRRFDPAGPASFSTWLRAVTRNLCLDWRRKRFGRPRPYRSIQRLPQLEREIYNATQIRCLTESEAFHSLRTLYPSLTRGQFASCLVRIQRALSSQQSWLRSVSNPRLESISSSPRDRCGLERDAELPDPSQDPEDTAARREYLEALRRALDQLPARQRLVVRLKFEQELSLAQIARVTDLDGPRSAQSLLHKTIGELRRKITRDMAVPVSVKDG